jgi:hypothetical protein
VWQPAAAAKEHIGETMSLKKIVVLKPKHPKHKATKKNRRPIKH